MSTDTPLNELPKQYDHAAAQDRWYPFWEEQGYFHSEPNPERQAVHDRHSAAERHRRAAPGPCPEQHAAGHPHPQKRMQGFETLWMPGTDHAGIATQAVVERRLLEEEKTQPRTTWAARGWSSGSGSGRTPTRPASSAS